MQNLTNHTKTFERTGKCSVGHALAAINWNRLKDMHNDQHSISINDGMKTIVCQLKRNPMGSLVLVILQMNNVFRIGLKNCHLMTMLWNKLLLLRK